MGAIRDGRELDRETEREREESEGGFSRNPGR